MEFQGKHSEHDALNDILRRYLAESEAAEQEGFMERAAESVFAAAPTVTPSASREADMLNRLRQSFPEPPPPGPASGVPAHRLGWIGAGALVLLTTTILLIFNPFNKDETPIPPELKTLSSRNARPLAQDVAPREVDPNYAVKDDLTSLQQGDGNPTISMLVEEEKIGTSGKGDRGNSRVKPWQPSRDLISRADNPDLLTVPARTQPPLAPLADNAGPAEEIDPFPLRGLYAQTAAPSKYYQLSTKEDHLIVGPKGTVLHIPRDAFVDAASGESVSSVVQVELKEVYRRSNYLKTNLPTVSNGRQLMSGGVLYVDASAAGRRLKLAEGKDIYVEFKRQKDVNTNDMQLYTGQVNARGEMNWVPVGGQYTAMIPLPPDEMYFDEFWCECKGAEALWNKLLWEISDPAMEETWIATREFRQRIRQLRDMDFYIQGLLLYRDHTDKDLWKVDQMVADQIGKDAAKGKTKDKYAERFQQFAQQMKARVEPFDDRGVDLDRWDARRQLMYRSVSREETERLLRVHRLRRQYVAEIEDRLIFDKRGDYKLFAGVRKGKAKTATTDPIKGYLIRELGWTNLDKPVDKNLLSGKTRNVKVRLTGQIPYESTRTFLVYTDINSMMPGRPTTGQLFKFSAVPRNANAWIVAIGYRNGLPYLGMQELTRSNNRILQINMQRTQVDDYMAALQALD
ncbi:MAG: hypothetical protein AAGN35_09865 [Bacteroidota bacterium]